MSRNFQIKHKSKDLILFQYELTENIKKLGYGIQLGFTIKKALEEDISLVGASLVGADLRGITLIGVNLEGVILVSCNMTNTTLIGVNLCGANLEGSNLMSAKLIDVSMKDASLIRVNMRDSSLMGVDLEGVEMVCSDLRGATFIDVNLKNTVMTGANTLGTNFGNSSLYPQVDIKLVDDTLVVTRDGEKIEAFSLYEKDAYSRAKSLKEKLLEVEVVE